MPGRRFVASLVAAPAATPAAHAARITGATPHERILVARLLEQRGAGAPAVRFTYAHAYLAEFGSGAS